jgi:Na+-translocating ferredoxin:NAD+ oxidoreductase RNF subunit RnfB
LANSAKGVAVPKLAVILEEAMAGTDCGACQYPTCKEYSVAIAKGECKEFFRCEPGGEDAQVEATQIMAIYMDLNKPAEGATETPAAPEGESAPATDV